MAGKSKGAGKPPSTDEPIVSGELFHLEDELQAHREATSARLESMEVSLEAKLQESLNSSLATFQLQLLAELKQMGVFTPKDPPIQPHTFTGSTVIAQADGSVRFGTIPPFSASSSTMARSEGNNSNVCSQQQFTDDLGLSNVGGCVRNKPKLQVEGLRNFSHAAQTFTTVPNSHIFGGTASQFAQQSGRESQQLGNSNFPIFNVHQNIPKPMYAGGSCPANLNPFSMSYSGPHPSTSFSFQNNSHSFITSSQYPSTAPHMTQMSNVNTTASQLHQSHTNFPNHNNQFFTSQHLSPPPSPTGPHNHNLPTMKQMRLEFQTFSGGDPIEWLNKADQYFEFYQIPEERKLSIATMHISDKAADRWYMFRHEFPNTWQGLSDLLMREFSCYNRSEYQAALARMNQTGSVDNYMDEFTKLSRRAPGFSPELLVSFFVGGLREEIRWNVHALKPKTL